MQALLASLVIGMSVKDEAFKAGMATARAEAKRTGQDFDKAANTMGGSIDRAAREVNAAAIRIVDGVANIGREVRNAGLALTVGLTVPLGAMGHSAKDTASDFESAMGRVHAAMVNASPEEMDKLKAAALDLGPAMGRSAIEAAEAIEALAKNGMSSAAILNGGLKSALTLAVVGQTDLGKAADLTTDIVSQFGKKASDLPEIVDRVSGALDASKMNFDDYRLAAGQAGGLVGALGYTFEDFNTALAATAPLFDSGADAGTSFRSFLTSLNAKSEDAERTMKKLGLSFYNADGSARPLAEIADQLQKKLANLSARSKSEALNNLFGTDGARTALALMKLGFDGVEQARKSIAGVTADQKLKILLDGEAASTQRLASEWQKLKIAVGEAGLIQLFTMVKNAAADVIGTVASAPPWFMKLVVASGLAAAAIGPLTIAAVGLAKFALPLLLLRLGPLALGFSALVNPVGVLIRLLGTLALQAGAATVVGRLGTALLGVAGPVGLLVTGLALLYARWQQIQQASAATVRIQAAVGKAHDVVTAAVDRLSTATGKARDQAMEHVKALRIAQVEMVRTARKAVLLAATEYRAQRAVEESGVGFVGRVAQLWTGKTRTGTARDLVQRDQAWRAAQGDLKALDAAMTAPAAGGGTRDLTFDKPDGGRKSGGGKSAADAAKDAARAEAQYQDALGAARVASLRADADLTESVRDRYNAEMAGIAEDRASLVRQLEADDTLNAAKRATIIAERDREFAARREIAERERFVGLAEQDADMARTRNEAEQELARAAVDLADNTADKKAAELRLLDLQRQQEEADLELVLATKATASQEWQRAHDRRDQLDDIYASRREAVERQNEGAGAKFLRELDRSPGAMRDQYETIGVDTLRSLNSDITDTILGTKKLGDAFEGMAKRIIASLVDIAVQQSIIKPLAGLLFGGAQSSENAGGGGFLSGLFSGGQGGSGGGLAGVLGGLFGKASAPMSAAGAFWTPSYGGGRATGGAIRADRWYDVGERGAERFFPGVSGTIVPNGGRGERSSLSLSVPMTIDARGADPAAIGRLEGALARFKAELPGATLQIVADAQQRGLLPA